MLWSKRRSKPLQQPLIDRRRSNAQGFNVEAPIFATIAGCFLNADLAQYPKARRMGQIRILLADDHTIFRSGLRLLLEQQSDFNVVAEAATGLEAVQVASQYHPQVAVLDIGMPQLNGIEAAREIVAQEPQVQVVILSMHADEGYVLRALKAGARAYILKRPLLWRCRGERLLAPATPELESSPNRRAWRGAKAKRYHGSN